MGETAFGIPAFPVATTAANIAAGTDCFAYDCVYDVTYTFPNGNVMTLALTREPGRAIWITRRDYEFNADSLQAAAGGENVLVMNFANAHVAGGGFWLGATAQEEALCRNSTLYASISSPAARALYRANNWPLHAMETDAMIYSPFVAVFRAPLGE